MPASTHFDAIVVGSGFGGSVMAYRLAAAGKSVCLLERGRAFPPGSFPRTPSTMSRNFWDPSEGLYGMFDVWSFDGLEGLVSSGLGGGSLIYANVLFAWAVQVDLSAMASAGLRDAILLVITAVLKSQIAFFWALLLFGGFFFFTDTRSPRFKLWGGLAHATSHLIAVFLLGWLATWLSIAKWQLAPLSIGQLLASGAVIAIGGYLIGPALMGLYLFLSVNVFGRHAGEFSATRCQDYKSWLRMKVASDGSLELYPIGIDTVPREWRDATPSDATISLLVPKDGPLGAHLVEPAPITVPADVIARLRANRAAADALTVNRGA